MKLVVFTLKDREYAIDVAQVREVIRTTEILPLPDVPFWIEGIINLRGDIIPILSLKRKLGIETETQSPMNRVIIAHRQQRCFGILVDNVTGVVNISKKELNIPDEILSESGTIHAVAKIKDRMIPLLDLYNLLTDHDTQTISQASHQHPIAMGAEESKSLVQEPIEEGSIS